MSRYTQNKLVMLLVGALKCVKVNIKTSYARKALKFVLSYVPLLKKFVCFFTLICFHSCVYLIYRLKPVLLQNCAVFITVWTFAFVKLKNTKWSSVIVIYIVFWLSFTILIITEILYCDIVSHVSRIVSWGTLWSSPLNIQMLLMKKEVTEMYF